MSNSDQIKELLSDLDARIGPITKHFGNSVEAAAYKDGMSVTEDAVTQKRRAADLELAQGAAGIAHKIESRGAAVGVAVVAAWAAGKQAFKEEVAARDKAFDQYNLQRVKAGTDKARAECIKLDEKQEQAVKTMKEGHEEPVAVAPTPEVVAT